MARKNKILSSPYCSEIHEKLARGETPEDVSRWLENEHGEKISSRTMRRYKDNNIDIKTKIKASYNKRKAQKKALQESSKENEIINQKVENKIINDEVTDEYTESVVDALEIIDSWIPKVSEKINVNKLSEYQKACFLCKMLDIKLKYTIGPSEDDEEFNLLDVFNAEIKVIK